MFCSYCGSKLDDGAVVCPNCGAKTGVPARPAATTGAATTGMAAPVYEQPKDRKNNIAVAGFVLSFFFAIPGLICSIIGYNKAKTEGLDHQGLALAGIILSVLSIVGQIISTIIMYAMLPAILAMLSEMMNGFFEDPDIYYSILSFIF